MNNRQHRYGPNSYLKSTGTDSQHKFSTLYGHDALGTNKASFADRTYEQITGKERNSPLRDRMRSPSLEEAMKIEQRHQQLKQQISLKEKQLADMTGERNTVNMLRKRLGLKDLKGGTDKYENSQNRRRVDQMESARRGLYSSVSPDHSTPMIPSMVGMKSTTYGRPTSYDKSPQNININSGDKFAKRFNPAYKEEPQQLHFHPTKLAAYRVTNPSNGSGSPLRSRSRSKGADNDSHSLNRRDFHRTSYTEFNNDISKISPYSHNRSRLEQSPLRKHQATIVEENVESSENLNESQQFITSIDPAERSIINPQRVQPLKNHSGRPPLETFGMTSSSAIPGASQEARDRLYRERIEAMTQDNQSLQRRLNQVNSELERIQRENEDIVRSIEMNDSDVARLNKMISLKDDTDAQNSVMEMDVQRIKDANADLNQKLNDQEFMTNDASNKLVQSANFRQSVEVEYDTVQGDFRQRISKYENISREKSDVVQHLSNVNIELDRLTRDDRIFTHENIEMENHVQRLQNERRELLSKIQHLTVRYDEAVKDISFTKRHVESDNGWQIKLIVFKKLHTSLNIMIKKRKQSTFFEIQNYSKFDHKCHQKLRSLALRMEKCGHYRMRTAINQWYDNSLKPYNTRIQNEDISMIIDCNKLQAKVFYALKQFQQDNNDRYQFKTQAIKKIWHKLLTDSLREKKRHFDIWKQKKEFEGKTLLRLKRIFKKSHLRKCEDAFQSWTRYSNELEYHCRVRVLHLGYTRKQFMSHAFHEFRNQIRVEKQNRVRYLNSFFKAWQDYIRYNRHLMQANMAAIAFRQRNHEFTARACFQALKLYTEQKKFQLLDHAVKNDVDTAISSLGEFNEQKQAAINHRNQMRFIMMTNDCLTKKVFSYFEQWKNATHDYNQKMNSKIKDRIIKTYLNKMRSFFTQWKKLNFDNDTHKKTKIMQQLQSSNTEFTNEALMEEGNLRQIIEGDKTIKRKTVDKTARKLYNRRLQAAMNRWKDILNDTKNQQGEAAFVIKKLRNRLLRQAFDRYLEFNRWNRQHCKNEMRADYIVDTIRLRELRKMYNALVYYTEWRKKIKKCWHHVLFRFDYFQKQRGIKRWKDNAHLAHEFKMKHNQLNLTDMITNYDDQLQKDTVSLHVQKVHIDGQEKSLAKKSYKQIGNYFIRIYMKQTYYHFQVWKEKIRRENEKKAIIKRSIEHYNKKYLENIQRVFVKFMTEDRQREKLEEIKCNTIECTDIDLVIKSNRKRAVAVKAGFKGNLVDVNGMSKETQRKVEHTMEWMAQQNLTRVWRSKKRMIFEMWRTVVKEETAFIYCVKNAIEKSAWKDGFAHIKNQSRDIDFTTRAHSMLYRYSIKGQRIKMGDSFTKWKRHAFTKIDAQTEELQSDLNRKVNDFDEFRDAVSKKNMERVCGYLSEKNKQNIWRAWLKVINHLKLVKQKTVEFKTRQRKIRQKYGILRWQMRVNNTLRYRTMCDYQVAQYQKLYMRQCFNGWKRHYSNTKRLCVSLSNLERVTRAQVGAEMFKNLKAYKTSKDLVISTNQKTGAIKAKAMLSGYINRVLEKAFQKYKSQCALKGEKGSEFKGVMGKFHAYRLRDAFNWWKKRHELADLKQDMHNAGPVRAEFWLAERKTENLKQFMRDQHYTELEVNKFHNDVCAENDHLMNKYMTRLRYLQDPNKKLLPMVMDRWKGYVATRKNVKHQFKFIANFNENQKAMMQIAFNKWKRGSDKLEQELWRLDIKDLETLAWRTTEELKECGDQIGENQAINNHLILQRDEFLNYYIKGQVLAMALVKDRTQFAKMQAMSRWLQLYRADYIQRMKIDLRDAEYYRQNQEERKEMLEEENETMEEENEEMRQFQTDGEIVKRNKARLVEEVEAYKDSIEELQEEMERMEEIRIELMAKIQDQEGIKEENKRSGKPNTLEAANKMAQLKQKAEGPNNSMANMEEETEEQKQQRLKIEQLDRLRNNGPALR